MTESCNNKKNTWDSFKELSVEERSKTQKPKQGSFSKELSILSEYLRNKEEPAPDPQSTEYREFNAICLFLFNKNLGPFTAPIDLKNYARGITYDYPPAWMTFMHFVTEYPDFCFGSTTDKGKHIRGYIDLIRRNADRVECYLLALDLSKFDTVDEFVSHLDMHYDCQTNRDVVLKKINRW